MRGRKADLVLRLLLRQTVTTIHLQLMLNKPSEAMILNVWCCLVFSPVLERWRCGARSRSTTQPFGCSEMQREVGHMVCITI